MAKREVLPQEVTVTFDYEVSIKNENVKELVMRKPKVIDIINKDKIESKDEMDKEFWIISALTGVPISDLHNLDLDQYQLLQEAWGKYLSSQNATT